MGRTRTDGYTDRFHEVLSKIAAEGIDISDVDQRRELTASIVAILPQFPGAWPEGGSENRSRRARVMHTLGSVAKGKQHSFNKSTESAIRAGLAYYRAMKDLGGMVLDPLPQEPDLHDSRQVLIKDLETCGQSTPAEPRLTLGDVAEVVAEVAPDLTVKQVIQIARQLIELIN